MRKYIRELKKKAKAKEESNADKEKTVEPNLASSLFSKMEGAYKEKLALHFSDV